MKSMKYIIGFCVLLCFTPPVQAQKALIRQAGKHYEAHNFDRASKLWIKAFHLTNEQQDRKELAFRIGSAFHRMNQFEKALQWYADANGNDGNNPDWLLAQADAYLKMGQVAPARNMTEKVLNLQPYSAEAKRMMLFIRNYESSQQLTHPKIYEATTLNTKASDYAASWFNHDLVLSSSRTDGYSSKTDGRTAENYSALYLSVENLYGDFGQAILLPLSGNKNTGVMTYDSRNKRILFTRCNNNKKRCTIMESTFDATGFRFSKPVHAGFVQKKYQYGHPHLREDGKVLYFSANLPGGFGGNDIYSITLKDDGSWGIPVNAGPAVNTAFDEVFPTSVGDSILIFSSQGHETGFGGLDLYAVYDRGNGFEKPQLLLPPFNSTADDFSLSLRPGSTKGVLSSNRNQGNSDDIFFFDAYPLRRLVGGIVATVSDSLRIDSATVNWNDGLGNEISVITNVTGEFTLSVPVLSRGLLTATHPAFHPEHKRLQESNTGQNQLLEWLLLTKKSFAVGIRGRVTERETGMPMEGERITLLGPGGAKWTTSTDENGIYGYDSLRHDRIYTVKVSGAGYFTESRVLRTPESGSNLLLEKASGYDLDFELTRITEKKEITLNDIYYDFDKAALRESSKTELQKLASMLRETPGVKVQISSHTDERGTAAYNDKLSLERAQSVVDYLIASGIASNRLIARGYGKTNPIFKNAQNESQHQTNRRTTFQVVAYQVKADTEPAGQTELNSTEQLNSRLVFRVQVLVSANQYDPELYFAPLKQMIADLRFFVHEQGTLYRYEAGDRLKLEDAEALRNMIRSAGFPDSFIVPYIDQQKVTMQQAKDFEP